MMPVSCQGMICELWQFHCLGEEAECPSRDFYRSSPPRNEDGGGEGGKEKAQRKRRWDDSGESTKRSTSESSECRQQNHVPAAASTKTSSGIAIELKEKVIPSQFHSWLCWEGKSRLTENTFGWVYAWKRCYLSFPGLPWIHLFVVQIRGWHSFYYPPSFLLPYF